MKNHNGHTYIELLVSIFIASFVVLTVGAVSSISHHSHYKLNMEASIFSDIAYGFKLLQSRVRKSNTLSYQAAGGQWLSDQLIVDQKEAFGIYQSNSSSDIEFVYADDISDLTGRQTIFRLSPDESVNMNLTLNGKKVTVHLSGRKSRIPFELSTTVSRRI